MDLQKAFDTISIPILIEKLEGIGIRGVFLNLLHDYLTNRTQQVKLDATFSSEELTKPFGVPQGSVLGPTLFLIYINELAQLQLANGKVFSYADDTALLFHGTTWKEVYLSAQTGLNQVIHWLNDNTLTLNAKKTNYITFSLQKSSQPDPSLQLAAHLCKNSASCCDCINIEKVQSTKYLGIYIDQHLNWHNHIDIITSRIRKLTWLFKYLRHIADKDLLMYIYKSLAQPILSYCLPVWGGADKTYILTVERAQRFILKIALFKNSMFRTKNLYQESDILTVRQLYILNCIIRQHKKNTPDVNRLKKRHPRSVVTLPKTRTTFATRQFQYQSAFLYNKINKNLNIYSLPLFKCKTTVSSWLKSLNYDETESLLKRCI